MTPLVLARSINFTHAARVAMLALCYFAAAKASLLLAIPPGYATAIWPPSGIAFAAVLLWGMRVWPGVWLGAALVNFTVSGAAPIAAAIATGNTLEALIAAWLAQRLLAANYRFRTPENVFMFASIAAAGSVVAATVGASALQIAGAAGSGQFFANWYTWWQGDTTGIILITPAVLAWCVPASRKPVARGELAVFWGLLGATLLSLFLLEPRYPAVQEMEFLLIPFMAWAGCRYGKRTVTLAVLASSGAAIWGAVQGHYAPELASLNQVLLVLQAFTSTLALMALALYALSRERGDEVRTRSAELARAQALLDDLDTRLERRSRKLIDAQRSERRQLALELHEQVELKLAALQRDLGTTRPQLQRTLEYVRILIEDLRAAAREEAGLLAALKHYAERFERRTGVLVEVTGSEGPAALDPAVETALFRIAHEAFENVAQHAKVRHMRVELDASAHGARLSVRDDGAGFSVQSVERAAVLTRGRGLVFMHDKAAAVGARLRVESAPGNGTTVTVEAGIRAPH